MVGLSVAYSRTHVISKLGGLDALIVQSWPRVVTSVILCNMVSFGAFQTLWSVGPFAGTRLIVFLVLAVLTLPLVTLVLSVLSWVVEGQGVAMRVKGFPEPSVQDVRARNSAHIQIVARGAVAAYIRLIGAGMVFALYDRYS